MSELLTGLGSRSPSGIAVQRFITRLIRKCGPPAYWAKMGWDAYAKADRIIALTDWEAELMRCVFDAPANRVKVVPNGVAEEFLADSGSTVARGKYLVCAATITERKRIVETALAALEAGTPLWIIGRPYAETDPYAQRFFTLAKEHSDLIRYEGPIQDRHLLAQAYRQARGFVLLSTQESLSLSALEAAACECPLLLSDLPWARTVFKDGAAYCPNASASHTAKVLRRFYDAAPGLKLPAKPSSWMEVARQLEEIYKGLLSSSR
jgi:glycosyltransferase involved in cell wall biosynthesis